MFNFFCSLQEKYDMSSKVIVSDEEAQAPFAEFIGARHSTKHVFTVMIVHSRKVNNKKWRKNTINFYF